MTDPTTDPVREPSEPSDPADPAIDPGTADPGAVDGADLGEPVGPPRPTLKAAGVWLVLTGLAVALDGIVGGLTMVVIAAVLLAGASIRLLGGLGVALLALAPIAFLVEGVPTASTISPVLVTRSLLPHHLTFSGLVLVSAFALLDLGPHLQAWASAERPVPDDGPPLGTALGIAVVAVVAVGALLACRAVLGA